MKKLGQESSSTVPMYLPTFCTYTLRIFRDVSDLFIGIRIGVDPNCVVAWIGNLIGLIFWFLHQGLFAMCAKSVSSPTASWKIITGDTPASGHFIVPFVGINSDIKVSLRYINIKSVR